jgi:acetamidase/formamidase
MTGVIGVAPVAGGTLTIDNGTHGGNLDIQEVTNGNRVMFPVFHEGAYGNAEQVADRVVIVRDWIGSVVW